MCPLYIISRDTAVSANFTCPEGSQYLPCNSIFPICYLAAAVCDRIADCARGVDEDPSLCETSKD